MFRFVVLSCLLVFVQSARFLQKPIPDGRIVGGVVVDISDAPFMISLQYLRSHICGGSWIAEKHVLTAAHCVRGLIALFLSVRAGSSEHASGGARIGVKRTIQHPQYNPSTMDYDFAIVELYNYNSNGLVLGYVNLPTQGQDVPDGTLLTVYGWGDTQNSQESRANLRAVDVAKYNQGMCNTSYSEYGGILDTMICAGYEVGGKDSCQGDSGGPLMYNSIQVGIVSWGNGCAMPNYPGVYSRVAMVTVWTTEIISGNSLTC